MRKTIIFDGDIETEEINQLISQIHSSENPLDLFFSTDGGSSPVTDAFLHFVNRLPEDHLHIYFTGQVSSAGAVIMRDYRGKKIITKELDCILIHAADRQTYSIRNKVVNEKFIKQDYEDMLKDVLKMKDFFNLSEIQCQEFIDGKDVRLYKEDFHRIKDVEFLE